MMNENIAVSVKNLKKAYKGKEVLKGVNFEIEKGMIFCLLGSNGAGKTTTIKILSTLLQMDSGVAVVNGYDVVKQAAKVRNSITLTGQFTAVDDIMSGRENMEIIARLCHSKSYKQEVDELMRKFNLENVADKRVATYSGGMKRRLDIAMSLLGKPKVIFLDEPTTGLDPQSRIAMWEVVKAIQAQGVTIFLTTQYLDEAEQLADRVAILHEGVIIANDRVDNIKAMVTQEYIEFSFLQRESMEKMKEIFAQSITAVDEDNQQITLQLAGGIDEMTSILTKVQQRKIQIASFTQKKATLEDVFLRLVNAKGENV